ncbi:MAG: DEAD/DEAH box helicase family protein [Myxococcales bacterium]|nr:DEAD/DEAH box helicase family protein [Myxococcales bacterium]
MKLKFDATLGYQAAAIQAAVDLFQGNPSGLLRHPVKAGEGGLTEAGFGNELSLADAQLLKNLRDVQARHGLLPDDPDAPLVTTDGVPHYSVEMETGTGKTYVYLRTMYALNQQYGWTKFVIVVPSVAIREGVLSSIRATKEHFDEQYAKTPCDAWVYDSKRVTTLRAFATSNQMQVLVINIDAFNKKASNLIYAAQDRMYGEAPIDFIRNVRPVVIIDEPQNMETATAREAIAALNPLCTLRYSATHRHAYNRIYRLGPVEAYDQKLVKRIEVDSVLEDADFNKPFVEVESIELLKRGPVARLRIDVQGRKGPPARKTVKVDRNGFDLYDASGQRAQYRDYIVSEINGRHGFVAFGNGQRVYQGQSIGAHADDVMKVQIRRTVREHFEKELSIARRPAAERLKVLSLFFIDRVANYADEDGKIRRWFVEVYTELAADPNYASLKPLPVDVVHNGYFAQDRKGKAKDTSGSTKADDDAYALIMKDKERLLSPEEPLRFIFSHSALREGWDNPNVFQICTLNDSKSEMRKRQEIGRGLRLPVRVDGERCHDPEVNILTVVANEAYESFAKGLQDEIEKETGQDFTGRVENKRKRAKLAPKPLSPEFKALWDRIKFKTRYAVTFDTDLLVLQCCDDVAIMPAIEPPRITVRRAELKVTQKGVAAQLTAAPQQTAVEQDGPQPVPDALSYLQRQTELTRTTLARILVGSGRLADLRVNAQQFLDQVVEIVRKRLTLLMIDGLEYVKLEGDDAEWAPAQFEEQTVYEQRLVKVTKSVYDAIEVDSGVERDFATALEARKDIKFFIKLPRWFTVPTPLGTYNPDWALSLERDGHEMVYLVRETKGTTEVDELRPAEKRKIICGGKHFQLLDVDFGVVDVAEKVT